MVVKDSESTRNNALRKDRMNGPKWRIGKSDVFEKQVCAIHALKKMTARILLLVTAVSMPPKRATSIYSTVLAPDSQPMQIKSMQQGNMPWARVIATLAVR